MPETGFSKIKITALILAVALVGVSSVALLAMKNDPTSNSASASPGSTKSIDSIADEEASDEEAVNSSFDAQDQDAVSDTDKAADNIGGAYDDADL